ncbi:MAG: hypothetical protein WCP29_06075 [Acidobacteriota bacterium]
MARTLFSRLTCYLSGHEYAVRSDGARIYLCCEGCGRRSTGWSLADERLVQPKMTARSAEPVTEKPATPSRRATA